MPRESTLTRDQKARIIRWFANANLPAVPLIETDALIISGLQEFAYSLPIVTDSAGKPFNAIRDWLTADRIDYWNPATGHPAANSIAAIATWQSDFRYFIDEDIAGLPTRRLILEIPWFTTWTGSGSYTADRTRIRPALSRDVKDRLNAATDWTVDTVASGAGANVYTGTTSVAGPTGAQNPLLPGSADAGFNDFQIATPNDAAVKSAITHLMTLGYDIGLMMTPTFINMPGGTGEAWKYWRGDIGAAAGTWASQSDFAAWVTELRVMFVHYANLARLSGVIPWTFIMGSSLNGITKNSNQSIREYFTQSLYLAARQIHDVLGPTTNVAYLEDWSAYHADSANATMSFPVDALQSNPLFLRYGLHWKTPIADHDEQSPCTLAEGVFHGLGEDEQINTADPDYDANQRFLVDSANPSDGEGYPSSIARLPLDSGFAYKNLPAFVEGAHYTSAANVTIVDPTPPTDWANVRALVSPAPGTYIETNNGIDLGGVTLSNLVGPSPIDNTLLATVYTLPIGLGVRTAPWEILKHLPLDGVDDYYVCKGPEFFRQYRVTGTGDPFLPGNTRNLMAASATNVQPSSYDDTEMDAATEPGWQTAGLSHLNHNWLFEATFTIDNIPHVDNQINWLAWGEGTVDGPGIPFFAIGLKKLQGNNYHEFTFKARTIVNPNTPSNLSLDGWLGRWEDEFYQDENRIYPSDFGQVYRVQMKLSSVADNPHPVAYAECRVWNVTQGNRPILNQAIGLPSNTAWHWFCPGANFRLLIGAGYVGEGQALSGFLPGKLHYAGMWEWKQGAWGGHFWLDDGYASNASIRTGWIPGMKQAMLMTGAQSMSGMQTEPNITPTLFADDGTLPALPTTFDDYPYWRRLRQRYDNANVYDLSGPYGAKFVGDERIQALVLAVQTQQHHNTMVRRTDGTLMAAVAEVLIDRFDARPADVQMAPDEAGDSLYFHEGPIRRVNHDATGKLWPRLARAGSGGRPGSQEGPQALIPNGPTSPTPFPIVPAPATNSPAERAIAKGNENASAISASGLVSDSRVWYGQ